MEMFDGIHNAVLQDRSQFFKDLSLAFYGYNRPDAKPSPTFHRCIKLFRDCERKQ
jgi:hypothetical protein